MYIPSVRINAHCVSTKCHRRRRRQFVVVLRPGGVRLVPRARADAGARRRPLHRLEHAVPVQRRVPHSADDAVVVVVRRAVVRAVLGARHEHAGALHRPDAGGSRRGLPCAHAWNCWLSTTHAANTAAKACADAARPRRGQAPAGGRASATARARACRLLHGSAA